MNTSKNSYVWLGIFLGWLGIHNFVAHEYVRGIAKVLITLLSCGVLFVISWAWALIEVIMYYKRPNKNTINKQTESTESVTIPSNEPTNTVEFSNESKPIKESNNFLTNFIKRIKAGKDPEKLKYLNYLEENIKIENQISNKNIELAKLNSELEDIRNKHNLAFETSTLIEKNKELSDTINALSNTLIDLEEESLYQNFGLYTPMFNFAKSDQYKDKLQEIRKSQKEFVKTITAQAKESNWLVNGKKSEGQKMVKAILTMLVRSFNSECDECIEKVKFNNIEMMEKRLKKSFEDINKIGQNSLNQTIANTYLKLKLDELHLAYEYAQKKQQEKEEERQYQEELREARKLEMEIKIAREKIKKEKKHFENEMERLNELINKSNGENLDDLQNQLDLITGKLSDLINQEKDIDYREQNNKAGYVYIISNIGSFGENVYKIGVTRRLDPMERIKELGDASVPFTFDVHAIVFSDNAFALENTLHKTFEHTRLNKINCKKEFFSATLEEIQTVVKDNFDKTVEFNHTHEAEHYRLSLKMS